MAESEAADSECPLGAGRIRRAVAALLGIAMVAALPLDAFADCKPRKPRPRIALKTMGPCGFDSGRLQFAGDPRQQAACLVRPVAKRAKLGPVLETLPDVLAARVGQSGLLPAREALSAYLSAQGFENDFAAYLWLPVTRANDNDPAAPMARYFVIHDTSGPFLGGRAFPADIDTHRKINNLAGHRCEDGWESAHVIISRSGGMLLGHELAIPWRATKFERGLQFGDLLKGLFVHVEMIQPRRGEYRTVRIKRRGRRARWVRRGRGGDSIAPVPGFSTAQYERLALVYTIASVRADRWLIPAFHAVLDNEIRNGHDDPQNFELAKFAASLERLLERLRGPAQSVSAPDKIAPAPQPETTASIGGKATAATPEGTGEAAPASRPLP
jgi:hypothetical protein